MRAALTDGRGYFRGEIDSYDILPTIAGYSTITGTKIKPTNAASIIQTYWREVSQISSYRVAIRGRFSDIILESEAGSRVVGAINRYKGGGAILYLPLVDFRTESFYRKGNKEWTDAGLQAGQRFVSVLSTLVDALAASGELTPAPDWTSDKKFRLSTGAEIECEIGQIDSELTRLQQRMSDLQQDLLAAAKPRRLLFEKGKPLEEAVLESLRAMGYQATGYDDGELEFDAVFSSPEGKRFIGEAEGRDSKAINIEKFSQLERKLNEDLSREEVDEYAKGILFGNAYRLLKPEDRAQVFTDKCLKAAKRTGYALIRTPDMFSPTRYLREHPEDSAYAEACRTAIWNTVGGVVQFPVPPPAAKE